MNVSRPFRCLFAKSATASSSCLRRSFHSSSSLQDRPKPKHRSIKASKLTAAKKITAKDFSPYSDAEKAALANQYTPDQWAAIEAGEAAIDPADLAQQAAIREDSMALEYIDDLAYIHPVVDKPVRAPESNFDPNLRLKEGDELVDDLAHWVQNLPPDADRLDWIKFRDNVRLTVGKEEAERNPRSSLAPELPEIPGYRERFGVKDGVEDIDPAMRRLMRQTGYSVRTIRKFRFKQLVTRKVVNQTRLGKVVSMYYLTVAGNGKGMIGIGEGKSTEVETGKMQAQLAAIRNLTPIPRYEDRTIYGDVTAKVGATELVLMNRAPGILLIPFLSQRHHPGDIRLTNLRVRLTMSITHIRDVQMCRYSGYSGSSYTVKESNEHC